MLGVVHLLKSISQALLILKGRQQMLGVVHLLKSSQALLILKGRLSSLPPYSLTLPSLPPYLLQIKEALLDSSIWESAVWIPLLLLLCL